MKGANRPQLPRHRITPPRAPWPLGTAALAGFVAGAILALLPALQGRAAGADWSALAAQAAGSGLGFAIVAALTAWVRNRMTGR